ncbi:MAG TPA: NF038122 family metalloprotease [Pyrinomonadaceae bacterium]|nr:NF038122 family metalloprotease [Pyrinomonadaceae bacterium]
MKRENEGDRMARLFLPEVGNDTSPPLRNMVQVPVTPQKVGFAQSTKPQETTTARGTDSGAILVSGISPDTNGEMGSNHRVKIVSRGYQIFDKLTGASVLGPSDISTIWASFGNPCETGGAGDVVVLYDKLADRWVISQFASATNNKAVTEECFAVSTTSDPTGSYYRYAFHLGTNFIDSPHLSVQADGYLMGDSVYNESGTERLGTQFFVFDRTAMLAGTAAAFTSPGIDTGIGETYSISADGVRVTSEPNSPAVSTLTINLTYASDATFTAAGLTAQNITDMKAANTFAASQFTNNLKDPINVNITVTAVPGTSTLGGSNTSVFSQPFTTGIRDPTRADGTSPDDATVAGAGGSVPSGLADPIGGTHNWFVTKAQRKALSIAADDQTLDGTYTFGGGFSYTYDPNNRAVAGKYDYIGVSMHEFSEIMGRIFGLGKTISQNPAYLQMDLFHYTAANTRGLTDGAGRSFSINNGTALLKAFNNHALNDGDGQDWAGGTNDSFNAFSSSGVKNDLTAVDLQAMDVIGYDTVPGGGGTPPANDTFANAQVITGSSGSVSGTNVSATKESGEPNHGGNAGGKSVWYRWQSPSTGTVTFTTTGSNFDTTLGIYTGSSVSALTSIASNDDDPAGGTVSLASFSATAGTTYRIAVDGFDGASGNITLNWNTSSSSIQTTVQTNPTGRSFTVDGTTFTTTQTFAWTPGSSHTITTTTPQNGVSGTRFVWSSWSDGGAISHNVAPTSNTTYTANFTTQFQLTMNAGSGGTVSPASGFFNSGQSVQISATPNSGFGFSGWTGSGTGSFTGSTNPVNVTMNAPITETASFTQNPSTIPVTVQTNPAGRSFMVDGTTFTTAQTLSWVPGSSHTISTASPQSGGTGTQFVWSSWSDSGAISHNVAPTVSTTFTANFTTQFQLAISAASGGTVSPASGFFNSGQNVQISATANSGFTFNGWTGSGTGSFTGATNPVNVTMNGPISETASFSGSGSCTPGNRLQDTGFESTSGSTLTNPFWNTSSTQFGTSLCSQALCGAISTAAQRSGTYWAWFGGTNGPETGMVSQTVTIPSGGSATLHYYLWIGAVNAPFTDVLNIRVDGTIVQTITEPSVAESGYTQRGVNLNAYTNGAQHTIAFEYISPSGGNIANFSVDDVTLDIGCGTFKSKKTGVFRPSTGALFLKNTNSSGFADTNITFGNPGDYPIAGDWNGDGIDSVGIYRNGVFYLRNTNSTGFADIVVPFGNPSDQPVVGDWNGDGVDTIGVYRNGTFILRNSNTAGPPDLVFTLGNPGDVGIAGDWNGDGITTCGVFRPSNGIVYLKNSNTTGFADLSFVFGNAGDKPVAGDWNGDGIDTVGIYRNGLFYLTNSNTTGFADIVFALGNSGDFPIAGNWNGTP